jgi:integrase
MESPQVTWRAKDKSFRFHYRDAKNLRKTKSIPVEVGGSPADLGAAQAWADEWHINYTRNGRNREPVVVVVKPKVVTFRTLAQDWLDYREDDKETSEGTWKQFVGHTKNYFLKHALADYPIEALTPHYLASVVDGWKKEGSAPNTIGNRAQSLTSFFHDVRVKNWTPLASNPMKDEIVKAVIPSRVKLSGPVTIYLPIAGARTLLHASPADVPEHRMVKWTMGLYTGARDGEQQGAAWEQIYLDAPVPYFDVTRQLTIFRKFSPPKKNSFRQIPLHPELVNRLRAWKQTGWKAYVGREPRAMDPVFPGADGSYQRTKAASLLRADLHTVRVSKTHAGFDIDAHALRRTFATLLADAEVPDVKIGALMGHAKINVTDAHYIFRRLESFVQVIRVLDCLGWNNHPRQNEEPSQVQSRLGDLNPKPTVYELLSGTYKPPCIETFPQKTAVATKRRKAEIRPETQPPQAPPQAPEGEESQTGSLHGMDLDPSNPDHVRRVMEWLVQSKLRNLKEGS